MPLYAYRCTACGAQEEHIQRFSDPPKEHCEVCGGALEKQLGGASFHLKGGGWYKDGYASSKPGSGSSSSSDGGGSSGGDAGSSSAASPTTTTGTGAATSKPDSGGSSGGGTDKGKSAKAAGE